MRYSLENIFFSENYERLTFRVVSTLEKNMYISTKKKKEKRTLLHREIDDNLQMLHTKKLSIKTSVERERDRESKKVIKLSDVHKHMTMHFDGTSRNI